MMQGGEHLRQAVWKVDKLLHALNVAVDLHVNMPQQLASALLTTDNAQCATQPGVVRAKSSMFEGKVRESTSDVKHGQMRPGAVTGLDKCCHVRTPGHQGQSGSAGSRCAQEGSKLTCQLAGSQWS